MSSISLATIPAGLARADSCPADLGVIGGGYQVVKFNSQREISRGDPYLPSVNWIVRDTGGGALVRIFYFKSLSSGEVYECVGSPYYWPGLWKVGEQVFFDACQMEFPADMPSGRYQVGVALQDANSRLLPAVDSTGTTLADHIVPIGEITLVG